MQQMRKVFGSSKGDEQDQSGDKVVPLLAMGNAIGGKVKSFFGNARNSGYSSYEKQDIPLFGMGSMLGGKGPVTGTPEHSAVMGYAPLLGDGMPPSPSPSPSPAATGPKAMPDIAGSIAPVAQPSKPAWGSLQQVICGACDRMNLSHVGVASLHCGSCNTLIQCDTEPALRVLCFKCPSVNLVSPGTARIACGRCGVHMDVPGAKTCTSKSHEALKQQSQVAISQSKGDSSMSNQKEGGRMWLGGA